MGTLARRFAPLERDEQLENGIECFIYSVFFCQMRPSLINKTLSNFLDKSHLQYYDSIISNVNISASTYPTPPPPPPPPIKTKNTAK
jgi:hypothetical protein